MQWIDCKSSIDHDIYVIDLDNASNEISKKLVKIFENKENPLIYFVVPKKYTLILFQLMFSLNTKDVITHSQNVFKIISKIKKENVSFIQSNFESWLGNTQVTNGNILVYKDNQLTFISEPLLSLFECHDNDTFEEKILSKILSKTTPTPLGS